jgi:transposase
MTSANTLLKNILGVKNAVVQDVNFSVNACGVKILSIRMRPKKKEADYCPICHKHCPVYDRSSILRSWRALDFAGVLVYITAYTQRISCPKHGVLVADVPWAFHNSGFTKSFDLVVTWMAENLSRSAVAEYLRIDWKTVGRCISRVREHIEPDRSKRLDNLVNIGIDETSYRKGHKYITVIVNHDTNTVVWVSNKHGKEIFSKFLKSLTLEQRASIKVVTGDGARWIDQCIEKYLPNCARCVDSFHVVEWANEALNSLRKEVWRDAYQEFKELKKTVKRKRGRGALKDRDSIAVHKAEAKAAEIKGSAYALGKAPEHLTNKQETQLAEIAVSNKRLYRGYLLKEQLRLILHMSNGDEAKEELDRFFWRATHSRIEKFRELGHKIRRHEKHILNTIRLKMSNARIESTNNKIKLIIRRAFGFRDVDNMLDMIMLVCSNIKIPLPNRPMEVSNL